jgi:hypothetical protein
MVTRPTSPLRPELRSAAAVSRPGRRPNQRLDRCHRRAVTRGVPKGAYSRIWRPNGGVSAAAAHDRRIRHACSRHALDRAKVDRENLPIQEQLGAERLVPRRCAHLLPIRQPREKRRHVECAHRRRVLLVMEHDVAANPGRVGLFSPPAAMPGPNRRSHAMEEFLGIVCGAAVSISCRRHAQSMPPQTRHDQSPNH